MFQRPCAALALMLAFALLPVFPAWSGSVGAPETASSPADLLAQLRELPLPATYLALREAIIQSPSFNPYSEDIRPLFERFREGKFSEVLTMGAAMEPNCSASPRFHRLRAACAEKSGDAALAELEHKTYLALVVAIKMTGDGSPDQPYRVIRVEDEYDVLEFLHLKRDKQSSRDHNGMFLDVLQLEDGKELCFELTAARRWLENQFKQKLGDPGN